MIYNILSLVVLPTLFYQKVINNSDSSMSVKLSDFQILKELGSGSFGTVKLVRKKDNDQQFAMKTISLSKLSNKEKDNALNEVRLLASIQIPNVIGYKASFFDK